MVFPIFSSMVPKYKNFLTAGEQEFQKGDNLFHKRVILKGFTW